MQHASGRGLLRGAGFVLRGRLLRRAVPPGRRREFWRSPFFCCGGFSTTICGDECCAGGSANPDCVTVNGVQQSGRADSGCLAEDGAVVVCGDACCNGRCCPSGTCCAANGCQPAGVACTTDGDGVALGYENCAGVGYEFLFDGPNDPTLVPVAGSGTCCVVARTAEHRRSRSAVRRGRLLPRRRRIRVRHLVRQSAQPHLRHRRQPVPVQFPHHLSPMGWCPDLDRPMAPLSC